MTKKILIWISVFLLLVVNVTATISETDISAHYNMDYTTPINDSTGNFTDGTNTNTDYNSTDKHLGDGSRTFDGTDLITWDTSIWNPSSDEVTVSLWAKLNSHDANDCLYYIAQDGNQEINFQLTSGNVKLFAYDGGGTQVSITHGVADFTDDYHHYAFTWKGGANEAILYFDGVQVGNDTSYTVSFTVSLHTSGRYRGVAGEFDGQLDELTIFNRKLTEDEISDLYNSGSGREYPFIVPPGDDYFDITAKDLVTQDSLNNFTVQLNGTNYTTTNGTVKTDHLVNNSIILNLTFYNVNNGTYNNHTILNHNLTSDYTVNLSTIRFYAYDIDGNAITPFNVISNLSGAIYSLTTTANKIPYTNGTYSFTFQNDNYANTVVNQTIVVDYNNPSASTHNVTFNDVYTTNSVYIYIRNDNTLELINETVNIEFINDLYSYNYSTSNGSIYVDLLSPADYTIRYYRPADSLKNHYYFTLTNRSYSNLTLYLANFTEEITVTVYDELTTNEIQGAVVYLQRYYQPTNQYTTVAQYTTDTAGKAYFLVQKDTEYYRFLVDYPLDTRKLETEEMYIQADNVNLYISLTDDVADNFFNMESIVASITYLNSRSFRVTYSDSGLIASQYCLYIKEYGYYGKEIRNSSCSSSPSSAITLDLPATNTTYYAVFTATISGEEKTIETAWKEFISDELNAGDFGVFMSAVLIMLFAFLSAVHVLALIFAGGGLLFAKLLGLLAISWGNVIIIFIASIILAIIIEMRK